MVQKIGEGGTFSSTGFFYIFDGANTAFTWQVANFEMIGIDEPTTSALANGLNVGFKQGVNVGNGNLVTTAATYLATDSGNVGIGDTTPTNKLDVTGAIGISDTTVINSTRGLVNIQGLTVSSGAVSLPANSVSSAMINDLDAAKLTGTVASARLSGSYTGITGVGTISTGTWQATPVTDAYVADAITVSGGTIGSNTISPGSSWTTTGTINIDSNTLVIDGANNRVGVGTATPSQALHVAGSVNVTANVFYGGNLTGYGADFAEKLVPLESISPGDVVCLAGRYAVVKCRSHANKTVAGVVSTHATIIGNAANAPNGTPVGIVGIIPTRVKGSVALGEMLTTSSFAGYAEKASPEDFGAIIGKAMEPCDNDTCTILVLVSLR
jgi:hypothetical protein